MGQSHLGGIFLLVLCCTCAAFAAKPGPGFVVHMTLEDEQLPEYGPSFKKLDVEVTPETVERLHVKILPSGVKRWEVPNSIVPRPGPLLDPDSTQRVRLLYAVHQPFDSPGNPFALKVMRKPADTPVFDTTGHRFIFKDQYIELSTAVPEDADLYGLGEVALPSGLRLPRDGRIITLYNRDTPVATPYANVYGSHPFFLQVNKDGTSHGVLFLNSNGMDIVLNKISLTYKVIGGVVDLYFFLGPTPEAVIRQYHEVVGAPAMPPYWALGVHQGRWGYNDVQVLEQVVANYSAAGIPLEALWLDIEYMGNRFKTLTFDKDRFPAATMRAFVDKLHSQGQKWVPIHDSAVAKAPGYEAFDEGTKWDVWIKEPSGEPYVGQVWPGEVVYPDYLAAPNVQMWIKAQLQRFFDQVPFDGLWLDMNEASNFCSGNKCKAPEDPAKLKVLTAKTPKDFDLKEMLKPLTQCVMNCEQRSEDDKLANPPYMIHNRGEKASDTRTSLDHKTISPSAVHADGTLEYDAHNLFGTAMALRSAKAATEVIGKRPFFLLRASAPGSGRVAGHWGGDNAANWAGLFESVASVLAPSMWGIAMSGADICGFLDEGEFAPDGQPRNAKLSDAEYNQLCNRWTSAGAFYPFVRNHFTYDARAHEPYRWPDVAAAARKAYGMRYRLLTYLYSSMHLAHSRGGGLARPLFFTDPADSDARSAEGQWMMGEALLVSPVVKKDAHEVNAYFTSGAWYSAWDLSRLDVSSGSNRQKLRVPLGDVALHLRGGTIIPLQEPALVTRNVRLSPITLLVALPSTPCTGSLSVTGPLPAYVQDDTCANVLSRNRGQLVSCGYIFMDSGEDVEITSTNSVQAWFTSVAAPSGESGSISSTAHANAGEAAGRLLIESIKVLGMPALPKGQSVQVTVDGKALPAGAAQLSGDVLTVTGLKLVVGVQMDVSWQYKPSPKPEL